MGLTSSLNNQNSLTGTMCTSKYIGTAYDIVKLVADNLDAVVAVSDNLPNLVNYLGASSEHPTTRLDGSPLEGGDYYFDEGNSALTYYNATTTTWTEINISEILAARDESIAAKDTALGAANTATDAASVSTTKALEASTSESNASTYASNAATSESTSEGHKDASALSEANAEGAKDTAVQKAIEAATSAGNAATSESNAGTSASNAADSAADALADADRAQEILDIVGEGSAVFNADGDGLGGGTDDAALLQNAFDSLEDGATLVLPKGKILRIGSSINVDLSSKSIRFNMNGSELCFDVWEDGLTFDGGWDSVQAFGAIAVGDPNDTITGIPDTSLLRPRDFIRIVSDDAPKDTWKAAARQANDLYIESIIDANTIEVSGPTFATLGIDNPYITNPRIGQRSGNTLHIYDGVFSTPEGQIVTTAQNNAHLHVDNLHRPLIENVSSKRAYGASIKLKGCINAVVDGGFCGNHDDLKYDGDQESYGYGITDSSFGTMISNRSGYRLRHFIDTDDQAYGDNKSPELYGGSVNMTAMNCKGYGTTNSTFSSHHGNKGTEFHGCTAYNSIDAGFGLRGDVTLRGCKDYGCTISINMFDEKDTTPSRTAANVYDHVSDGSGPLVNANYVTPQHFYNYTAKRSRYDGAGAWMKDRETGITQYHGHTRVEFLDGAAANPLFGARTSGTILFDTMEWDVSSDLISDSARVIRCDEGGPYDYVLKGNHLHLIGSRPLTVFRNDGTNFPTTALNFKVTMDSAINYTSSDIADTMILAHQANWAELGGVTESTTDDLFRGARGKIVREVVDFGTVAADARASTTVTVLGTGATDKVLINAVTDADVSVDNVLVTGNSEVTVRITNLSGVELDLSAVNVTLEVVKL